MSHLDFQLFTTAQVFSCHPETPRSHLFDRRAGGIAIAQSTDAGEGRRSPFSIDILEHLETGGVFTALTAVALAADAIHRDRQHFMGFTGQGAEAHATRAEARADALNAFHLIEGKRGGCQLELQQVPQGHDRSVLQQGLVRGEMVVARALGHCLMQCLGEFGVVAVVLSTAAVLNKTHELELASIQFGEGLGMHRQGFIGQFSQGHPRDPTGGSAEGDVDHIGTKTDRLEDLSAVVASQQGDPDLGQDLAKAIFERHAHIGLHLIGVQGRQLALLNAFFGLGVLQPMTGGLPGEPGTDGTGAVPDQASHVVRAPALRGIHHQGALQPELLSQQMMVHRSHGQQRWHGHRGGGERSSGT